MPFPCAAGGARLGAAGRARQPGLRRRTMTYMLICMYIYIYIYIHIPIYRSIYLPIYLAT